MNLKAEENRRYINLYNTVNETKGLFEKEKKYLTDIITHYKNCKAKKEKEILRDNIRSTLEAISGSIQKSEQQIAK